MATRESRTNYRVDQANAESINFIFALIANRLDALEGLRGTPTFSSDVDAQGNKITNVGGAETAGDALSSGEATTDSIPEGAANLYFTNTRADTWHQSLTGNHGGLERGTSPGSAATSSVSVTTPDAGAAYGANEQTLINELKTDVNSLVSDVNAAIGVLNNLTSNMVTAKLLA